MIRRVEFKLIRKMLEFKEGTLIFVLKEDFNNLMWIGGKRMKGVVFE